MSLSRFAGFLIVLSTIPTGVRAVPENRTWLDPNGGSFQDGANWSAGGPAVPDGEDTVIFSLGDSGYTVSFTANASNAQLRVDDDAVTFDLSGFSYLANSAPIIGSSADDFARFTLVNGFMLSPGLTVSNNSASEGTVVIGSQAHWQFTGQINVGSQGVGSLTVTSGGQLSINPPGGGPITFIGGAAGAIGSVNVSGAGSTWSSANVFIGGIGTGTFTVSSSADATVTGTTSIGDSPSGAGTLTVTGPSSRFRGTSIGVVGNFGRGTLQVLAGGRAQFDNQLNVAAGTGSQGTVLVSGAGSLLQVGGTLGMVQPGNGQLKIEQGGVLTTGSAQLGGAGGATVIVRDPGSTWDNGPITIGSSGVGTLWIDNGGRVTSGSTAIIGTSTGSSGNVIITGAGSRWDHTGQVQVGNGNTTGMVRVENGAVLNSTSGGNIGAGGGFGTVTLDGTGSRWLTPNVAVGNGGTGIINVRNGASLSSSLTLGSSATGNGTFILSGAGSIFSGFLGVGTGSGTGVMRVEDGAQAITIANVDIGQSAGATGGMIVSGGGARVAGSSYYAGGSSSGPGGTGRLTIAQGGSVDSPSNVKAWNAGIIEITGGDLKASAIDIAGRLYIAAGSATAVNTFINTGDTQLDSPSARLTSQNFTNSKLIHGEGTITANAGVNNTAPGEFRVTGSRRLLVNGPVFFNAGKVNLIDGGTLEVNGQLNNSASFIATGGGTVIAPTPVINNSQITASGGFFNFIAGLNFAASGKALITGGATATFHQQVNLIPGADFHISTASTAVFLAPVTGSNNFTGPGTKIFEAGASPIGPVETSGVSIVEEQAIVSATHFREAALTVDGRVQIMPDGGPDGVSKVGELNIGAAGKLDITNNAFIVDYAGTSPMPALRSAIFSGYAGGAWAGVGINSSTAAIDPTRAIGYAEAADVLDFSGPPPTFIGQSVDDSSALIRFTVRGDLNLDGSVSFADLIKIAANFGINDGTATWSQGDINYDGNVGFVDLIGVAAAFGSSLPASVAGASAEFNEALAAVQTPEPTQLALVATVLAMALSRRANRDLREQRMTAALPGGVRCVMSMPIQRRLSFCAAAMALPAAAERIEDDIRSAALDA
jgi:T5SS/PEP-CTERM-associated repeat protein